MPLPVINYRGTHSAEDLTRLFHQTEARWTEHMAEAVLLDVGTAYANAELAEMYDANNIRDVALPDGLSPADAVKLVDESYTSRGTRCAYWTMNPAVPTSQTAPLAEHLLSLGHKRFTNDILALGYAPDGRLVQAEGLRIIPARASFKHTRMLWEAEIARKGWPAQCVDAQMSHLDDPHWDALLGMKGTEPVAYAGVLAVGEIGRIESVLVADGHRRAGIAVAMLSRALEICARSLFRHVMLCVDPTNEAANALYRKVGFKKVGEMPGYFAPWTKMT